METIELKNLSLKRQEQLLKFTVEAVNEIVRTFQFNPYQYLFESDIQAMLFGQLRNRITEYISLPRRTEPRGNYDLSLVYSEYGKRIDIACLDVFQMPDVESLRRHKGFDTYIYELPVLIGIELKYLKMGDRFDLNACIEDYKKLQKLQVKYSLVLGFIQETKYISGFFEAAQEWTRKEVNEITSENEIFVIGPNIIFAIEQKT